MADWQVATLIKNEQLTPDFYSLTFEVDHWKRHLPGQHYDIRLTSEDGYQAQRSYSIASSPDDQGIIELGVQLLTDGEVSPYLIRMKPKEQIEVKGPLGGHFIWDTNMPGPLLLLAGGSGIVPFMSMIRHYLKNEENILPRPIVLLMSASDIEHLPYYEELNKMTEESNSIRIFSTLTKKAPSNWTGFKRRIDREMLEEVLGAYRNQMPMIFVCGSTPFVENMANSLVDFGFESHFIKTERFGGLSE